MFAVETARNKNSKTHSFSFDFFFQPNNSTALHVAVDQEDLTSLHIVDFLAQNWYVTD